MPTRVWRALGSSGCLQQRPTPACANGSFGVVFVGLRITEVNQHAVAHIFRYEAAEAAPSPQRTSGRPKSLPGGLQGPYAPIGPLSPLHPENITVTWRRSARSSGEGLGASDAVATSTEGTLPPASVRRTAIASSSLRRCPSDATPSSLQVPQPLGSRRPSCR